tara:strand:- start:1734 stop:2768 length:1035 start_codon:yes stop_codon:yes gene_type:complete
MALFETTSGAAGFVGADVQKYFISPLFLGNDVLSKFDVMGDIKGNTYLDHFSAASKITSADNGGKFAGVAGTTYTNPQVSPNRVEAEIAMNGNSFYNKVKGMALKLGTDKDNVDGTVLKEIASKLMLQGIQADFNRQLWFGNTAAIVTGGDYSVYEGIWASLQAKVPAAQLVVTTYATNVANEAAIAALEVVYGKATAELKELPKTFYVSGQIADDYVAELTAKGVAPAYSDLQNGIPSLSYRGIPIVVRRDWDTVLANDFAQVPTASANLGDASVDAVYTSAAGARIALIADGAMVVGTDFEGANVESWYNQDEKEYRFRFGYNCGTVLLDAKLACTYISEQA